MKSNTAQLKIAEKYLGESCPKCCHMVNNCCCYFVSKIFDEAGNKSLFYGGKTVTYCPNAIKWCKNVLAQIPPYLALPSDIIFFDWELNGTPNHIGFVAERVSDQEVATLEGNTSGGVVARRTRTAKYIQGIYRPHFKATYKIAKLDVDGYFGYNSIAMLQKVLGVKVDGILGKDTVKALQKKVKVTQDGSWGEKTSRAVQKMVGTTVDGAFGVKSVKALQRWINRQHAGSAVVKPKTWQDRATEWAEKIAKSGDYHYVKYSSDKKTHECPICHPRKDYQGWNCIGFAFACWHHGGGIKNRCTCDAMTNQLYEKMYHAKTDAEASEIASERLGVKVKAIRNNGKAVPLKDMKAGDIAVLFKGDDYYHTEYYQGEGLFADCTSGREPNIKADVKMPEKTQKRIKLVLRYMGAK